LNKSAASYAYGFLLIEQILVQINFNFLIPVVLVEVFPIAIGSTVPVLVHIRLGFHFIVANLEFFESVLLTDFILYFFILIGYRFHPQ